MTNDAETWRSSVQRQKTMENAQKTVATSLHLRARQFPVSPLSGCDSGRGAQSNDPNMSRSSWAAAMTWHRFAAANAPAASGPHQVRSRARSSLQAVWARLMRAPSRTEGGGTHSEDPTLVTQCVTRRFVWIMIHSVLHTLFVIHMDQKLIQPCVWITV